MPRGEPAVRQELVATASTWEWLWFVEVSRAVTGDPPESISGVGTCQSVEVMLSVC